MKKIDILLKLYSYSYYSPIYSPIGREMDYEDFNQSYQPKFGKEMKKLRIYS